MRRREYLPLSKHTMNFYEGDVAKLQMLFPPRIGASKIIRDVIHNFIREIEDNAAKKVSLRKLMESADERSN